MSESEELETLVYCLGQIGGEHNPVMTSGSAFDTKYEYTTKGYARYIQEANNVIKFMNHIIDYFLESVKSEFEGDPLAFIDSESEEDSMASIQKMKKQWRDMFKDHQKELRDALRNKTLKESSSTPTPSSEESSNVPKQADEDISEESSSSSSAKMPRLDPKATSEASKKTSAMKPESTTESKSGTYTEGGTYAEGYTYSEGGTYTEGYTYSEGSTYTESSTEMSSSVGVPVESVEFPESIFLKRFKDFGRVLKKEYQELRAKVGKVLDRVTYMHTAHNLKGFTLQRMEKFAKWKYAIKTLDHLVPELESELGGLDLDFHVRKENEKRLTDWLYFDDGKRDRKYYHRLLITMDLTGPIDEISTVIWKQLRRHRRMKEWLETNLPEEYGALVEKEAQWKYEVLYHRPMKKPVGPQTSNKSDDTSIGVEDMPLDPPDT